MKKTMLIFCMLTGLIASAQRIRYTTENAHSHNDYEQKDPFWAAYNQGFGSIEADIFLTGDKLLVAHEVKSLDPKRSLSALYLDPLVNCVTKNNGYPFADPSRVLQILIDIKTAAIPTLDALVQLLGKNEILMNAHNIHWVITGNRPDPAQFTSYPAFIRFDGVLDKNYSKDALSRIALMSDDWRKYSTWQGSGEPSETDLKKIKAGIKKSHHLKKPVRFWGGPDVMEAWLKLQKWKVDFINTDHVPELAGFIQQHKR